MQNKIFLKKLKTGSPDAIYFLYSNEDFLLEEALKKAVDIVIRPHQRDFNYHVFYPSTSPQEIIDTLYTLPFLARRRLVILKNFHQFSTSHMQALIPYFKNPVETTCMIIISQKEPKSNLGLDKYKYSLVIKESDIPAWIKQTSASKDIEMSKNAVDYLLETVGPDIGLLSMEIEKLSLSGCKTIEDKDVLSSTGPLREYTVFELIDALIAGQKLKAFKILNALTDEKPSAAPAILGALNWHYREFYALLEKKGKKPQKMRNTVYMSLLRHLPHYTQEIFFNIFKNLHETDLAIKSSGRPELALEILLVNLLQAGARN